MSTIAFELLEGKIITRALEYNIVEHCNLRCSLCDHSSPLMPAHLVPMAEFVRDVSRISTALHTSEFKLIGGEPLLNPEIVQLIAHVRQVGIADSITVATNGLLLHKMPEDFWSQIDRLWLSVYPGVRISMPLQDIEMRSRVFGFALDIFRMEEFRYTALSRPAGSSEVVRAIFKACELPRIDYCHTLRRGIYYKCSPAPFSRDRLGRYGLEGTAQPDGIPIHDNPKLLDELISYISCQDPLPACTFCLGSSGKWFPHRQMTASELVVNEMGAIDPVELIDWSKLDLAFAPVPKIPESEHTIGDDR